MKFKKISIGLIALWFLFLTAATFWSVKEENKTLPSVWTEEAQEGSIEYEFPVDLEVSAADQAIGYISVYDNVPESLLQEGRFMKETLEKRVSIILSVRREPGGMKIFWKKKL